MPPFPYCNIPDSASTSTISFSSQMLSQNVSQTPVQAPRSPPAEIPCEPVSLCEPCRKAHHEALRDDGQLHPSDWLQLESNGTAFPTLPTDEWPDLPRLLKSAQEGCGFCGFLREALLSGRFNDALKHLSQGRIMNVVHRRLNFELNYGGLVSSRHHFSLPSSYDTEFLIVKVTFEQGPSVHMHFEVEAIAGEQPGL